MNEKTAVPQRPDPYQFLTRRLESGGFQALDAAEARRLVSQEERGSLVVALDILSPTLASGGGALLFSILMGPVNGAQREDVRLGGLYICAAGRSVFLKGKRVGTTPQEFELLYHLAAHPNEVFSREQIIRVVWHSDYHGDERTVDTHIKCLRAKLGEYAGRIVTIRKAGYLFEWQQEEKEDPANI